MTLFENEYTKVVEVPSTKKKRMLNWRKLKVMVVQLRRENAAWGEVLMG